MDKRVYSQSIVGKMRRIFDFGIIRVDYYFFHPIFNIPFNFVPGLPPSECRSSYLEPSMNDVPDLENDCFIRDDYYQYECVLCAFAQIS